MVRLWVVGVFLTASWAAAQQPAEAQPRDFNPDDLIGTAHDIKDLSLEALLDVPISVATKGDRDARETPGVVTAMNREEILASGARDLLEVLQLIPGFSFHTDVIGVVGAGFRGMWGHEGKVLLLVDGMEMNELLYSTTQFGHEIPVHVIERVEVIRGPGSAVYGGNAELAVINVITRQARDLKGLEVGGRYAQMSKTYADRSFGISAGWAFQSGLEVAVNLTTGQGHRTQSDYVDFAGGSTAMRDTGWLDPLLVNASVKYKGLTARILYDDYRMGARDGYGLVVPDDATSQRYRSLGADLRYRFEPTARFQLTPYATWSFQTPWEVADPTNSIYYSKSAQRLRGGLVAELNPLDDLHLLLGAEGYDDQAWLNSDQLIGAQTDFAGNRSVSYFNLALYGQILWDTRFVNIAVGGRYEWNSKVGANFAPRIALTKRIDRFHVKLLYSGAFRSPGIENINLNPTIQAERMQVAEGEIGLQLSDIFFASANAFYLRLDKPIVYGVDPSSLAQTYINDNSIATSGWELEIQARGRHGFLRATYSLAMPIENGASTYQVPGHEDQVLAFAPHKLTAMGKLRVWRGLGLGGSAVFFSERWGYLTGTGELDADGNPVPRISQQPSTLQMNLWLGYENLGLTGLNLQAGVDNLFNAPVAFLQPYTGGHAPIYGLSRTFYLRLSYAFKSDR
ncbi:MAG: TonB-dependent receptor plug domain-containing protein [Archangiaceae bacterium]|nr:TonB-dependent receptor plug domain-containing protein [Archangiaceae bacterium]